MTDERPSAFAGFLCLVAFVVVFALALVYEFRGLHAGDPLAPAMGIGAVIVAGVCGLTAAGGVLMLFGRDE